jgi:hypothetical protein
MARLVGTILASWSAKLEHVQSVLRHALMGHAGAAVGVGVRAWGAGIGQVQGVGVGRQLSGLANGQMIELQYDITYQARVVAA